MAIRKNRAVFLDRDGVILVEKNFAVNIDDMEFIRGAIDGLKKLPSEYLKIIISNQSGIGRGYFKMEQVEQFNDAFQAELKKNSVLVDKIYYCPHSPEDNCQCRKPATGLFEQARQNYGIDFGRSWVIGDKSSDIQAGRNIGASTILVMTGYAGAEPDGVSVKADYIAENLDQAAEIIKNES